MRISIHLMVLLAFISFYATSVEKNESPLLQICHSSLKSGNYQQALIDCNEQLKINQSNENNLDTLFLYLYLVDIFHALGEQQQETLYLARIAEHPNYHATPEISYLWNRKKGQKHYLLKELVKAKSHLYQGLLIAKTENNLLWMSKSYNDVGLIESQLSEFRKSLLNYKKSLEMKLELGDQYAIGTTLNNIGLIYSKLENKQLSITYYEQALDSFLEYTNEDHFDRRVLTNINHIYEDLAIAYSDINDTDKESYYQKKTIESIDSKSSARQQARALVNIAKLQIEGARFQSARRFLDRAALLQAKHQFDLRTEIHYQFSRLYLRTEEPEKAISFANGGLIIAKEKNDLLLLSDFYRVLSESYKKSDLRSAYHYLTLFNQTREKYLEQKFDSELKSTQVQIEKQQIEHDLMLQQVENSRNQLKIQALTNWSLSAVILLLLSIGFTVFHFFKKKKEKQVLVLSIKNHQQQLLLLDDKYQNLNKSLVVNFENKDDKFKLREILVNTMLDAVYIWESHTGKNRVELAEKSKIWTISIDGGTLRTRSLDKYLSMDKIPLNPRWRNVAGTCHFVLSDPELDANSRLIMNQRLETLMQSVKQLSLTAADS
jgi:tetratricopeptide (TPR) repeat protein